MLGAGSGVAWAYGGKLRSPGQLQRVACACGLIPMVLASAILIGWYGERSPVWVLLGALNIWLGIGLLAGGLVLVHAYRRSGGRPNIQRRLFTLLAANLPLAPACAWLAYWLGVTAGHYG